MTERRVGTLLALFFFMTFAIWLSDAPLLPELHPPRRDVLDTVPLWPLDLWSGSPVTALLWNRALLYVLATTGLAAMFAFLLDRSTRLATLALAGLLAVKLAFLSWDLRYLTGADVVHLTMTALFLTGRPRVACLRVGLVILGLVGVVNRMNPSWVGSSPLLLAEAAAPLLWLSRSALARRLGVALWLGLQALSWGALSLLWPTSLAACGPLLLLGAALLVPLEGPLQDEFEFGPGAWGPALVLGGLLAVALWPGPARRWLHVHDLDAIHEVRARIVVVRGNTEVEIEAVTPRERSWNPAAATSFRAWAVVDGERTQAEGRLNEPLRLDGTLLFSPHRFRHASPGLLADPLFYRTYADQLQKTFHPTRLQIEVDVDDRRALDYDRSDPP